MNRVTFLIDGFNLYHSILRLKHDSGYKTKWLNVSSLCQSYIHLFGKGAQLEAVHYFSAIPSYRMSVDPGKIARHRDYIACLKSTGVNVELGRFKRKDVWCNRCMSRILKHEEKETDVAIAIKLFEVLYINSCDSAVIMTGDTDLAPAIKRCKVLFPEKRIIFAFPYMRGNIELATLAPGSFHIGRNQYIRHQFPDPVVLKDGIKINKPASW